MDTSSATNCIPYTVLWQVVLKFRQFPDPAAKRLWARWYGSCLAKYSRKTGRLSGCRHEWCSRLSMDESTGYSYGGGRIIVQQKGVIWQPKEIYSTSGSE